MSWNKIPVYSKMASNLLAFSVFTIQIEEGEHFLQAYLVLLTSTYLEGITRS